MAKRMAGKESNGGQPQRSVTIIDVAQRCGLSKATVSKALNYPADQCPLRHETRQRVLQAARDLGYRPDWRARALASQRTQTIGLLYSPPVPRMTGVYEEIVGAFTKLLDAKGYHLLFVPVAGLTDDWQEILLSHRLDGWVAFETVPEAAEETLGSSTLPAVLVNVQSKLPRPHVVFDDHDGAVQATRHLIELGHRRITFFHGPEWITHYSVEARIAGYREAMLNAGLADCIDVADLMLEEFIEQRLLTDDRPTAVLCYMHHFAVDMLGILLRAGVRVPQDLSIAAFNDVYPVARTFPTITTVALPGEWMGRLAAQLLLQQIESKDPVDGQNFTLKEKLVVRESTAPPAKR